MKLPFSRFLIKCLAVAAVCAGAVHSAYAVLPLTKEKTHEDDLAFGEGFAGIPAGEVRYVTREALAAVAGAKKVTEVAVPGAGEAELTVLPLPDLLKEIPMAAGKDSLLMICSDRWETFVPGAMLESHKPYLLLYYNGKGPLESKWPMFGGNIEALEPYYIYVSKLEVPGFIDDTPHGMVSATQVVTMQAVNGKERYAPFYNAPMDKLSATAVKGRELFLRNCNTCHQGPGQVGGNVSLRPFVILQTHASYNADYFRKFVTNPKQFMPNTIMPKHEKFNDADFEGLIAFLKESMALGVK